MNQNFFAMAAGAAQPAPDQPVQAILYGRVSTDKQDMDRQTRMFTEYCGRLHLVPLCAPICDLDTSGSIPFAQRDGGRLVLDEITRLVANGHNGGPTQVVFITTEQDRVGRDTLDSIQTVRKIWEAGIVPHFIAQGGALPRTPDNEFKMELQASFAQLERNRIRGRIRTKMAGKRAAGELCGQLSYGFNVQYRYQDGTTSLHTDHALTRAERAAQERIHGDIIEQTLSPNAQERKWLRQMHAFRQAGWGYHSIAKYLNAHRVPTKRGGETMKLRAKAGSIPSPAEAFPSPAGAGEGGRRPDEGCWGETKSCGEGRGEKPTNPATSTRPSSGQWNCGQIKNVLESLTAREILAGGSDS